MDNVQFFLLAGIIITSMIAGVTLGAYFGRRAGRAEARNEFEDRIAGERDDAVKRSRAVLTGLAAEQLAPWLPGFPFDPTEVRFIGKPVDFVAFVGSALGDIKEVAFVEVKSGGADLSRQERTLRDAVKKGKVRWVEYRPPV